MASTRSEQLSPRSAFALFPVELTDGSSSAIPSSFDARSRIRRVPVSGYPNVYAYALDSGLVEDDPQRQLANRVVFANQLVRAAVVEHAVPVLVDVYAVWKARSLAVEH